MAYNLITPNLYTIRANAYKYSQASIKLFFSIFSKLPRINPMNKKLTLHVANSKFMSVYLSYRLSAFIDVSPAQSVCLLNGLYILYTTHNSLLFSYNSELLECT